MQWLSSLFYCVAKKSRLLLLSIICGMRNSWKRGGKGSRMWVSNSRCASPKYGNFDDSSTGYSWYRYYCKEKELEIIYWLLVALLLLCHPTTPFVNKIHIVGIERRNCLVRAHWRIYLFHFLNRQFCVFLLLPFSFSAHDMTFTEE